MLNIVKNVKNNWKKRIKSKIAIIWLVAAGVFLLDFFIKNYLIDHIAFRPVPIIKNTLYLTIVCNRGAAFGILKGNTIFLIVSSIIFILIFSNFIKKENKDNLLFLIPSGMILGGAFSNLYDRIFLGFVIDYIDVKFWPPVFNLSDFCITVGIILLFIEMLIFAKKNKVRSAK